MPDLEDVDVSEQITEQTTRISIVDVTDDVTNKSDDVTNKSDKVINKTHEVTEELEEIPLIKPGVTNNQDGIFSSKSK